MITIIVEKAGSSDYVPQIIGIIGTILGAIIGWLLQLLSTNRTKINFDIDYFCDRKTDEEYAYIIKLFVCNDSYKPQCMRNVRLSFEKCRGKGCFGSLPYLGECTFETVRNKCTRKKETRVLPVGSYAQCEFIFADLINDTKYNQLSEVRNIYLMYENKKNRTKKILVKKNFNFNHVEQYNTPGFP